MKDWLSVWILLLLHHQICLHNYSWIALFCNELIIKSLRCAWYDILFHNLISLSILLSPAPKYFYPRAYRSERVLLLSLRFYTFLKKFPYLYCSLSWNLWKTNFSWKIFLIVHQFSWLNKFGIFIWHIFNK